MARTASEAEIGELGMQINKRMTAAADRVESELRNDLGLDTGLVKIVLVVAWPRLMSGAEPVEYASSSAIINLKPDEAGHLLRLVSEQLLDRPTFLVQAPGHA